MPIVNCGFAPVGLVRFPDGNLYPVPGPQALVMKGPTLNVEVGFNADLFDSDPAKVSAAVQATHAAAPGPRLVEALIDTGAGESCIDEELAKELQLPLIDQQASASGVGGKDKFNLYLGHIRIPALNQLQYGRFLGARMRAGGQPHEVLIGRTLFQSMVIVYDGRDGSVRIAV